MNLHIYLNKSNFNEIVLRLLKKEKTVNLPFIFQILITAKQIHFTKTA